MVLLRLEVRVYPKETAPTLPTESGGSNTSVFSRLIGNGVGNRNKEHEQNGDRTDSYELGEANPAKQYASFLLLLRNSDDLTLADLARRISEEWATFRSDQEPLEIKKLLDDANPSVDLSLSMTVADVFLDVGKALSDGHDQRATVRVIQKPARHAPQRFSSVVQDWDSAANKDYQHKSRVGNQFSPIAEESYAPVSAQKSPAGQRSHDAPIPSVEIQSKYQRDKAIPGTPPIRSSGSEELGESPSPEQGRRSKKRKPSPRENGPVKQRRLGQEQPEATLTSPHRKRVNVPTFASPHRRASLSERPAANNSIGLGVTKSPRIKKPTKPDTPSSQKPEPKSTPATASTPSGSMRPPSAMRKSSPASIHSEKRRSVSFNEPNLNSQPTPKASSSKAKTPRTKDSKPGNKTPVSASQRSSRVPPSSNTSTPVDQKGMDKAEQKRRDEAEQKRREEQFARIQKEVQEKTSLKNKLKDTTTSPEVKSIAEEMLNIFAQVAQILKERSNSDTDHSARPINRLKRKLSPLRKKLADIEAGLTAEAQEMETETSELQEEPEPEAEPEPEPSLRTDDARVTRSMRSPASAPIVPNQAPTWSFNNATSSTQKPETSRKSQSPGRRGSKSSANGFQASPPKQSPTTRPSRSPSVVLYKSPRRGSQSGSANSGILTRPHLPVQTTDTDVEMKDTDENDDVATEVATQETTQEAPQEGTMEATPEQTEEVTKEVNSKATEESGEESNNEAVNQVVDDANSVEEQGNESDSDEVDETDPTGDAEMAADREESPEVVTNGLIDDAAMDDDDNDDDDAESEDEEEEDSEDEDMDGFIDDGPEESEEEVYEDAKDHGESGVEAANGTVDALAEELDESNDQLAAQLNESNESGDESTEVPKGNSEVTSNGKADVEDESSKSDESESESESELELPSLRRSTRKQPNTPPPAAPGFWSTQQLASSQPKSVPKTTLKSLLQAAKQESTRQKTPAAAPAPAITAKPRTSSVSKPKSSVWEVPSSDDESDESDDSKQGDILPNGVSRKQRKPYSLRA